MSGAEVSGLASRLRERVSVQVVSLSSDGLGGNTESWSDAATVYAQVTPVGGAMREQVIAAQREARGAYKVVVRKGVDIDTAMRLLWQQKVLHVHGITETATAIEIIAYEGGEA